MRRRGRSIDYGVRSQAPPHSTSLNVGGYFTEPRLVISEVPEAWRKYAQDPWRILFPDLDWTPPERE